LLFGVDGEFEYLWWVELLCLLFDVFGEGLDDGLFFVWIMWMVSGVLWVDVLCC